MYPPKQEDSPGLPNPAFYIEHETASESDYSRQSHIHNLVFSLQIRINRCFVIVTLGRFMLMVIVATNAVVWLSAVMTETMEELAHSDHSDNSDNPANGRSQYMKTSAPKTGISGRDK